jgi:hypothetical protein
MASGVEQIEGVQTRVEKRVPPIPQKLDRLFAEMFSLTVSRDIKLAGARSQCDTLREHRLETIRKGRHFGTDRVLRDLQVDMCADCGAVCVRDISYDTLTLQSLRTGRMYDVPTARRGPVRRNHIIGWYSGARRNSREYR